MDGFEECSSAAAFMQARREDGYSSKQRGGGRAVIDGISVRHVTIISGLWLPPWAMVEWAGTGSTTHTIRMFDSSADMKAWLSHWDVRLGRPRPMAHE